MGIGAALQQARLEAMHRAGVRSVVTNADRPRTIEWYKRYGYREVGKLTKVAPFGDPDVGDWTTLELDLGAYMGRAQAQ
jgi:predicted N-acetyltransferase YhbS